MNQADAGSGSGRLTLTLDINGVCREIEVEPRTTLAQAVRSLPGLTGTKIACDRGACGACTVWLDGAPVYACMLLAVTVGRRAVTTIEGLAAAGQLHRVQHAFIDQDAVQCGFCTPGMIMSCAALLRDRPDFRDVDVREAISGNLCRCGTYPHVLAAMRSLMKEPAP